MDGIGILAAPIFLIWTFFVWLFVACSTGDAARTKGQPRALWFVYGILFGPLALFAIMAYAPTEKKAPETPGPVDPHAKYRVNVEQQDALAHG